MTKKKEEPAKAGKKKRADKQSTAGPDESEPGPASKIIDLKGMTAEEALKLALATPWPAEKKTAGKESDSEPAARD